MIDPADFARKQVELTEEFAKYVLERPEIDEMLPEDAYIYFDVEGDSSFNEYSRDLAARREREPVAHAINRRSGRTARQWLPTGVINELHTAYP